MAKRKRRPSPRTQIVELSDVDMVACDIGHFIRERIAKFKALVDEEEEGHDEDDPFNYYLPDIATRTLLIAITGEPIVRSFVNALFSAEPNVENCQTAVNHLDSANVLRWLRVPAPRGDGKHRT